MEKHFELTENCVVNAFGTKLFQIKATKKTKWADIGDLGGFIEKESNISGDAWVYGDAQVYGNARVYGDAWVFGDNDLCWFSKFGSKGITTTFFKTKTDIGVSCGCFQGTIKEFKKQVVKTHDDSKYAKEYLAMIKLVKIKFNI